jgi:DNA transformation protein
MAEKSESIAKRVVDMFTGRINSLGDITHKRMFGGYGIFESGTIFALVPRAGGVYLKSGPANQARFEEAGANKHGRMPYYQIPVDVYTDSSQLLEWVQEAIEVSKAGKK